MALTLILMGTLIVVFAYCYWLSEGSSNENYRLNRDAYKNR